MKKKFLIYSDCEPVGNDTNQEWNMHVSLQTYRYDRGSWEVWAEEALHNMALSGYAIYSQTTTLVVEHGA
jgi:hypothetical protein